MLAYLTAECIIYSDKNTHGLSYLDHVRRVLARTPCVSVPAKIKRVVSRLLINS